MAEIKSFHDIPSHSNVHAVTTLTSYELSGPKFCSACETVRHFVSGGIPSRGPILDKVIKYEYDDKITAQFTLSTCLQLLGFMYLFYFNKYLSSYMKCMSTTFIYL